VISAIEQARAYLARVIERPAGHLPPSVLQRELAETRSLLHRRAEPRAATYTGS
jgi:hypothetical protein